MRPAARPHATRQHRRRGPPRPAPAVAVRAVPRGAGGTWCSGVEDQDAERAERGRPRCVAFVRRHGSAPQLGFCGIKPMELQGMQVLNLFYRFATSAWGQGLAGEAATVVAAWAFRNVPDVPLIARVRPNNIASQRAAVRAGPTRAKHLDGPGYDGCDWIYAAGLPHRVAPGAVSPAVRRPAVSHQVGSERPVRRLPRR
ncbi:GNAT family N-acetyltransferase [Streptomyces massasporeus]|uniref:GNAT family N-acetyltransferase n=1 Tax=Streptomyces massasporeus TaxID=67324 RepID=UPI0033C84461